MPVAGGIKIKHEDVHHFFKSLVDPAGVVKEPTPAFPKEGISSDRSFTFIDKIGYQRKPSVKLEGGKIRKSSNKPTLEWTTHNFSPKAYADHVIVRKGNYKPFSSYVKIPVIHTTRTSMKEMQKKYSINKDLWKALDNLPRFNPHRDYRQEETIAKRELIPIAEFIKKLEAAEDTLLKDYADYVKAQEKLKLLGSGSVASSVIDLLNIYKELIDDLNEIEEVHSLADNPKKVTDEEIQRLIKSSGMNQMEAEELKQKIASLLGACSIGNKGACDELREIFLDLEAKEKQSRARKRKEQFHRSSAGSKRAFGRNNQEFLVNAEARKELFFNIAKLLSMLHQMKQSSDKKLFSEETGVFIDNIIKGANAAALNAGGEASGRRPQLTNYLVNKSIVDVLKDNQIFSGEFETKHSQASSDLKQTQSSLQRVKMDNFRFDLENRVKQRTKTFKSLSDFTKHSQETLDLISDMYENLYPHIHDKYFGEKRLIADEYQKQLSNFKSGKASDFDGMPIEILKTVLKAYNDILKYQTFETEFAKTGQATTYSKGVELALEKEITANEEYLRKMKKAAVDDDMELFEQGKHELQKRLQNIMEKIDVPAQEIERAGDKVVTAAAKEGYELVQYISNMFDEIEHIVELKEDMQRPEISHGKRAEKFFEYIMGTIENHDGVRESWRGEEIDYFEDLNAVFDNPIDPDKIFIGVTMHPENSTGLMSKMQDRFGGDFEHSKATDYDFDGSISWNDYHLDDIDIVYVHINIEPDAFSGAKDFDKAQDLARILFRLCDILDKPMYKGEADREIIKDLFGADEAYLAGDIRKYFVDAIDASFFENEIDFFRDINDRLWVFTEKLKKDISLHFILPKK